MTNATTEQTAAQTTQLDSPTAPQMPDALAVPVVVTYTELVTTEANAAAIAMF